GPFTRAGGPARRLCAVRGGGRCRSVEVYLKPWVASKEPRVSAAIYRHPSPRLPGSLEETGASFIVRDANGHTLVHLFRGGPRAVRGDAFANQLRSLPHSRRCRGTGTEPTKGWQAAVLCRAGRRGDPPPSRERQPGSEDAEGCPQPRLRRRLRQQSR